MKRSVVFLLACGSLPMLAGCMHTKAEQRKPDIVPPPAVEVTQPTRGTVAHTLELPADVVGLQEARLYAKVSGYLKTMNVDKGDTVKAGQLLATIDSPELEREVAHEHEAYVAAVANQNSSTAQLSKAQAETQQSEASYHRSLARQSQAQAEILKAKGDKELAQATYNRLKKVYDSDHGLIAKQDLDVAKANLDSSAAKLIAAEKGMDAAREEVAVQVGQRAASRSQVEAIRAQFAQADAQSRAVQESEKRAQALLQYTEIRAPFSGTITGRFLDPGALVQSAENTAQGTTHPVLSMANTDVVRIYAQIPESDMPLVHDGTPVELHADELPGKIFKGSITRSTGALDETTRTMLAEADVRNPGHILHPGMMIKERLFLEQHKGALTVPPAAVMVDGQKHFVYVVEGDKVKKTRVEVGFEQPDKIEIVSGLKGGENVVVAGKENLSDGVVVRIAPGESQHTALQPGPEVSANTH
jgi:RND family efflux transporter MFP subunit